jgi:hypothetical protein
VTGRRDEPPPATGPGHSRKLALALYPRAWRERYGEELVELVGGRRLGFFDWIDIVSGAIDARLSSDVRRAAASSAAGGGSAVTVLHALRLRQCGKVAISTREALIGAAVLVVGSLAAVGVKLWLAAAGYPEAGRLVLDLSFPVLYFTVTNALFFRGQSWRARLVLSTVLAVILGLAVWIARLI